MTKKIINCESDWYDFDGDTIRYVIDKLENIAKLYGDSTVISCCEISFIYSREETDEEYSSRLKNEAREIEREKAQFEMLKRKFGESSE